MKKMVIEPMRPEELGEASAVLGKAFSTSPMPVAAWGGGVHRTELLMRPSLKLLPGQPFVAKDNGQIVGVMKMVEWPDCQPSPLKMFSLMPVMLKELRGSTLRTMKWMPEWGRRDPRKPHWHFGPFGVLPERQGQGIGSQLLTYFCQRVDDVGGAAYLETDKPVNVKLYQRFGFVVTSEAKVLGQPNWFMWREAKAK
ncbi:MAG: GNAT family N-acetyltransferase [Chloroflexi bacterium]|nr:GNAT family N-acetyltransferase [Chloroflexota bacterium]